MFGGEVSSKDANGRLYKRLEVLRSDFAAVCGRPFQYFYCPVLLSDDPAEICRAHLVNQAFPKTSRRWTIQRTDVDNFYGSHFEADFLAINERGSSLETSIANGLSGRLRPEISHRGQKVVFYKPTAAIPPQHSEVLLESTSGSVRLALKIAPKEMKKTHDKDWQISINKDFRLAALVSLLKAAHLTLFEMLGYRYALSAGGVFLGKTVLGNFFLQNRGLDREDVLVKARLHFSEFKNLVQPVRQPNAIEDTVNQRILYICEGSCRWAFLIFIRTADIAHAVIVPQMESPDAAARFVSFLNAQENKFQARRCYFDGDVFQASTSTSVFDWPAVTLD